MKRIISLILVVVMCVLALASCGYNIAEDDMTAYATFSAENKALFDELLNNLVIVDGDFSSDEETRQGRVLDAIYELLAKTPVESELKTGKIGANDVLRYSYYCTANIDGELHYFYTANMKSASAVKLQLGLSDATDLDKKIADLFDDYDLEGKNYEALTSSSDEVKAGDVVFVTYTYSYTEKNVDEEGKETTVEKKGTLTSARVVVTEDENTFAGKLLGKKVNTSITDFEVEEEGKGTVSYTGVKVNWIAKGDAAGSFTHIPFPAEDNKDGKKVNDIAGVSCELKDVALTYYVYPVSYDKIPEITAATIINDILGKNITQSTMISILYGDEYDGIHVDHEGHDHDDDDFTEEEKEKMEALEEILENLKFTHTVDDEEKTYTLEEICKKIAELQTDLADVKEDLDDAKEEVEEAQKAYDSAKEAVDAAGENATQAQKDKLTSAEETLNKAKDALEGVKDENGEVTKEGAQQAYDAALADRDEFVDLLLSGEEMPEKVVTGYKDMTYRSLRDAYNKEIKMNLATEIYYFLDKYIEVTGLPEKAVDASYDQIMQNYQHTFRTGTTTVSSSKVTNYKAYNGDFKAYLVAAVTKDIKTVTTYEDALKAVRGQAEDYVRPIVKIYLAASVYDLHVDDEAYEEYVKENQSTVDSMTYYYGETSVRYAHQFDKLMNYFLESEEDEEVEGQINYLKVKYTLGEKSGSELDAEKTEEK